MTCSESLCVPTSSLHGCGLRNPHVTSCPYVCVQSPLSAVIIAVSVTSVTQDSVSGKMDTSKTLQKQNDV